MSRRKFARLAIGAVAILVAAAVAVPALAAAPGTRQRRRSAAPRWSPNRSDHRHDALQAATCVAVQTGGKITLSRQDEGSRTRSRSSSEARYRPDLRQMDACFEQGPVRRSRHRARRHQPGHRRGAGPDHAARERGQGWLQRSPGDSVLIPPGGRTSVERHGSRRIHAQHDLRDPSVDARARSRSPARRLAAASIVLLAAASATPAEAAVRHEWVAAVPTDLEHRAQRARRDHGHHLRPVADRLPDGRLPALHEELAPAASQRARWRTSTTT